MDATRLKEAFSIVSRTYSVAYKSLEQGELAFGGGGPVAESAYPWARWEKELAGSFMDGVPLSFLGHPIVKATMVFHGRSGHGARMRMVGKAFGSDLVDQLLVEDLIGSPHLCGRSPVTSPNRVHHAAHLAQYLLTTGKSFPSQGIVVEWGGGYGDAARVVRRLAPSATYVIIDLAAVGALQYVYLATLLGREQVSIVASPSTPLQCGGINIMTPGVALAHRHVTANAFMSTWALTESPRVLQSRVVERRFFGASNVLLAFSMDQDNHLAEIMSQLRATIIPVPNMTDEGYAPSFYGVL